MQLTLPSSTAWCLKSNPRMSDGLKIGAARLAVAQAPTNKISVKNWMPDSRPQLG